MANSFKETVTIVNQLGLHARAATKLAQLCMQFDAKIELQQEGRSADASSVLALLMLATVWTLVAAVWPAAFLRWGVAARGSIARASFRSRVVMDT